MIVSFAFALKECLGFVCQYTIEKAVPEVA